MGDGLHLLVDGLAREKLTEQQVYDFLCAMPRPEYLDMTLILGPTVYKTQGGWCGASLIAESHIMLHSNGVEVHADIFSCKPFDEGPVITYCEEELGMEQMQYDLIHRGWAALAKD